MQRSRWVRKTLLVIGALVITTGCTIHIGIPAQQQSQTSAPRPADAGKIRDTRSAEVVEVCNRVYELIIADNAPGWSSDLYAVRQAYQDAATTALAVTETAQFGTDISGMHEIIDVLIDGEERGVILSEESGTRLAQVLADAQDQLFRSFERICIPS